MLLLRSRLIPIKEWSARLELKAKRENHLSVPSVAELCALCGELRALSTFSFARLGPAFLLSSFLGTRT